MSDGDRTWGPLGEGEELLFEGRARGRPSLRTTVPIYSMIFLAPHLLSALLLLVAWRDATPQTTWSFGWTRIDARTPHDQGGVMTTTGAGPIFCVDVSIGGTKVPVPWLLLVAAGAAVVEVLRLARWRSQEVALTTRRLLTARGVVRRGVSVHARTGAEALHHETGTTWLDGLAAGSVLLPGLDEADRQAVAAVLPHFTVGPTPPPPRPVVDRRRVGAGCLVVVLALVVGWRIASAPGRVTAVFHRPGAPGEAIVTIEVDSPTRSGLRVAPWEFRDGVLGAPWAARGNGGSGGRIDGHVFGARLDGAPITLREAELDGQPWRPARYGASVGQRYDGAFFRTSLTITISEQGAALAPERVHLAGVLITVDGTELPFDLELGSPGRVELDLSPR